MLNVSVERADWLLLFVAMATAFPTPIDAQFPWERPIRAFYTYSLHLHFFYEIGPKKSRTRVLRRWFVGGAIGVFVGSSSSWIVINKSNLSRSWGKSD